MCLHRVRFYRRSGHTTDYKIGICCFSAKHTALRRKSKDWLAWNQDNVSEWGIMPIHGLVFQWTSICNMFGNLLQYLIKKLWTDSLYKERGLLNNYPKHCVYSIWQLNNYPKHCVYSIWQLNNYPKHCVYSLTIKRLSQTLCAFYMTIKRLSQSLCVFYMTIKQLSQTLCVFYDN